jgi:antitoxin FitA
MSTLHVRSVPDEIYKRIQQLAKTHKRSLSAQVIDILSVALEEEELRSRQRAALISIRRRRFNPPVESPTSLELLHEDRKR